MLRYGALSNRYRFRRVAKAVRTYVKVASKGGIMIARAALDGRRICSILGTVFRASKYANGGAVVDFRCH